MVDREKIVKGLEICTMATRANRCLKCPYAKEERDTAKWCTHGLHRDILALLKEQEPKPVKIKTNAYGTKHYYCPKCNEWFEKNEPYCHLCGQAVKWDE